MSTPFRTADRNRAHLSRLSQGWQDTVLAPDITTAREQPLPAIGDLADRPRAPLQRPSRPAGAEPRAALLRNDCSIVETRHPDIAKAISLLWGYPEMNEYFDRLWLADGDHGPLDPDAMSELMLLSRIHQSIVPQRPGRTLAAFYAGNRVNEPAPRPRDPWSDVPPRR